MVILEVLYPHCTVGVKILWVQLILLFEGKLNLCVEHLDCFHQKLFYSFSIKGPQLLKEIHLNVP